MTIHEAVQDLFMNRSPFKMVNFTMMERNTTKIVNTINIVIYNFVAFTHFENMYIYVSVCNIYQFVYVC